MISDQSPGETSAGPAAVTAARPSDSGQPRARKKRAPVGGETRGRKLHLPDAIHDRLWLLARQRRTSVSAVAADILDKNLRLM